MSQFYVHYRVISFSSLGYCGESALMDLRFLNFLKLFRRTKKRPEKGIIIPENGELLSTDIIYI